jgi:hypothetical protein
VTLVTVPGHETEAARTALREAVDALTMPKVLDVEHDDGTRSTADVPALLTQLANEINGIEPGSAGFTARSRPPMRLDALQLLTDIDRAVGARDSATRVATVHRWGQDCASALTGADLVDASRLAEDWLRGVRELLNPTPKHRLTVACPACGATKVWSHEDADNGETYARPALSIDEPSASCVCDACGARWRIELWEHLGQVLEQQKLETLAVLPYDPQSSRLRLALDPVQCDGRVRDHGAEGYRTRRCTALLDTHGQCRNAHDHEPTGEE